MISAAAPAQVHSSAIVEVGARLGAGCVVHAYAFVSRHCVLEEHVIVHPFAVLGGDPQDLSFDRSIVSGVRIGARTVLREHVTVNRATQPDEYTQIGSGCFLMAASHVAHDCRVGNGVVLANAVLLGGHVEVGDSAFLGGGAVVHQFCRIGESVMLGGGARILRDVAPFCMAAERNAVFGLNLIGLRRRGVSREVVYEIKKAWQAVNTPFGNPRDIAAEQLERGDLKSPESRRFLEFYAGGSRGFARTRRRSPAGSAAGEDQRDED